MAGLLGEVYGYIDSKKRGLLDAFNNPGDAISQFVGNLGDQQNRLSGLMQQTGWAPTVYGKSTATPGQSALAKALMAEQGTGMAMAGMFVGKGSKTWNGANAQKAEQLTAQGVEPRKVWSETGTWKGPDGMWRQEIPDNTAAVQGGLSRVSHSQMRDVNGGEWISENDFLSKHYKTPEANAIRQRASMTNGRITDDTPTVSDVINHPGLLNSYDELGRIPVAVDNKMSIGDASLGVTPRGGNVMVMSPTDDAGSLSNGMHELQHAIQGREGFARGGSPDMFKDDMGKYLNLSSQMKQAVDQYFHPVDDIQKGNARQTMDYLQKQMAPYRELHGLTDAHDAYRRLAGEAEARATQARIPLTAEQRLNLFPEDSYDVPMNQLIIRGLLGN